MNLKVFKVSLNGSANSSCAQSPRPPPPPPRANGGICPPCQSRGWGICKFCATRGPGICQSHGPLRAFDTHAVSYQNITTQRILLEKQADWLIFQGREKNEEVCKDMFSILCIHFFIAYQARITQWNRELSTWNVFFGYWIKLLLILFEQHPFVFIKLHNS